MISATIIKDSYTRHNSPGSEKRLTTFVLKFHRYILPEFATHRVFSKNTASSRAIPTKKIIEMVETDPAMPVFWGKNQPGMQAKEELSKEPHGYWINGQFDLEASLCDWAIAEWLDARDLAVKKAESLLEIGCHKQIVNRLLEPFMFVTMIVSATDYENFFKLRAHEDAQPEIRVLAELMLEQYNQSIPQFLNYNEWHIPFSDKMPEGIDLSTKLKIATARCARVSYLTFDNQIDVEKDVDLHDKLIESGHWSPFEHCAQAIPYQNFGNFKGFKQYRKQFEGENCTDNRVIKRY